MLKDNAQKLAKLPFYNFINFVKQRVFKTLGLIEVSDNRIPFTGLYTQERKDVTKPSIWASEKLILLLYCYIAIT